MTSETLVEVYGSYLNPRHVASVWTDMVFISGEKDKQLRVIVRLIDGQIFYFKAEVEQVVAAINKGMR